MNNLRKISPSLASALADMLRYRASETMAGLDGALKHLNRFIEQAAADALELAQLKGQAPTDLCSVCKEARSHVTHNDLEFGHEFSP